MHSIRHDDGSDDHHDDIDADIDDDEEDEAEEEFHDGNAENEEREFLPTRKRSYTFITRKKRNNSEPVRNVRWKTSMDGMSDVDITSQTCCKALKCFGNCSPSFLRKKMMSIRAMTSRERRQVLQNMIGSSGEFFFDCRQVCSAFLQIAFRFSRDLQLSVRNGQGSCTPPRRHKITIQASNTTSGATSPSHDMFEGIVQTGRVHDQKDAVITFLERVAENTGDSMPDRAEVHLPFLKKKDVFAHFMNEYRQLHDSQPPSMVYFHEVWRKHCSHVKVRRVTRFAMCSRCEQPRREIEDAVTSGADTTELR